MRTLLLLGLLLVVAQGQTCGSGESLIQGTFLGSWSTGIAVVLSSSAGGSATHVGNPWRLCVPNGGTQTIEVSELPLGYVITANSEGQIPSFKMTLNNISTNRSGLSFTLDNVANRQSNCGSFELPGPTVVTLDWVKVPPGFDFEFVIQQTSDRSYSSSLAQFNDCETPIIGAGLSLAGPKFLLDGETLHDGVSVDVGQITPTIYKVDNTDSTMATLQFCHILVVYNINPQTGVQISAKPIHRSLTKVSASINLARPFSIPSAIQLTSGSPGGSVTLDVAVQLEVFACDSNNQVTPLTTFTAGDTLRICVKSTPPPSSFNDITLTATPVAGGSTRVFVLVSGGTVRTNTVPGELILGTCSANVCSFEFSPRYSFFDATPHNMVIGGTVLLRIGNRVVRRKVEESDPTLKLAEFELAFQMSPPDTMKHGGKRQHMSIMGISVTMVAVVIALVVAAWTKRRLLSTEVLDSTHDNNNNNVVLSNHDRTKMVQKSEDADKDGDSMMNNKEDDSLLSIDAIETFRIDTVVADEFMVEDTASRIDSEDSRDILEDVTTGSYPDNDV